MNKEELMNLSKEELVEKIIKVQEILNIENDKIINNTPIKVGDMVRVIDRGECFSTYDNWSKLGRYVYNFVANTLPESKGIYKVVNIGKHDTLNEDLLLIQDINTTQTFIIGATGVEKVTDNKKA